MGTVQGSALNTQGMHGYNQSYGGGHSSQGSHTQQCN
jgi:hypothetical protein